MDSEERTIRFPPFPAIPEGVIVIPFAEFKERGIAMQSGEGGIEVDSLGVPTVELPDAHKHGTDECKTDSRRKKPSIDPVVVLGSGSGGRKEWWDIWEETELSKGSLERIDENEGRVNRFHQGAHDFLRGRQWPQIAGTRAKDMWDQFRIFAGLLSTVPIWYKRGDRRSGPRDDDEDEDLDEQTSNLVMDPEFEKQEMTHKRLRPRAPYSQYGQSSIPVDTDADIRVLLNVAAVEKEENCEAFLNDIERKIRVFLGYYLIERGFIWTDRLLTTIPHLIQFFLRFLFRNKFLFDHEHDLRRALVVAETAIKELPLTARIGKILPGPFSEGCIEVFGSLGRPDFTWATGGIPTPPQTPPPASEAALFEAQLKESNVELIHAPPDITVEELTKQVLDDNNDIPGVVHEAIPAGWDARPDDIDSWLPTGKPILMSLLGPTALPLTHTTGIIESSIRRVKTIVPPSPPMRCAHPSVPGPNAESVEHDINGRFAKLVLLPWNDGTKQEITILTLTSEAYDPYKDEITVIVPANTADNLVVGMGLRATWVQLVPQEIEGMNSEASKTKNKKKKKTKKAGERPWYMEQLMEIMPSYYLPEPERQGFTAD